MGEALCYKRDGHGFDTRRGEYIFSIYLILPFGLEVHSASNKNEYPMHINNISGE
jgi:hypothetical protein